MSEEPRYTREEWEEIQRQEWAEIRRKARERGDLVCTVLLEGKYIREWPRARLLDLLDTKLAQARDSLICHLEERDADP